MEIADILHELSTNLPAYDITLYASAPPDRLATFPSQFGFNLPDDVKTLYRFCNGFESAEDLFRLIPLEENWDDRRPPRPNSFYFAEYMIYCDLWEINVDPLDANSYTISNPGNHVRILTHSIAEFIGRFLAGGVFGKGGLYDWHNEIDQQSAG